MVAALVMIKAETDKVGDLAQALTGIGSVQEVFSVAGCGTPSLGAAGARSSRAPAARLLNAVTDRSNA